MIALFLIFWGTFILFSIVSIPIYIPINSAQVFIFPPHLHQHLIFCLFDKSYSVWGGIILWFLFPFPLWLVMFNTFLLCPFTIHMYSLVECLFSSFGNFLIKFFSIVLHEFLVYFGWVPCVFWILTSYQMWFANISLIW